MRKHVLELGNRVLGESLHDYCSRYRDLIYCNGHTTNVGLHLCERTSDLKKHFKICLQSFQSLSFIGLKGFNVRLTEFEILSKELSILLAEIAYNCS